MNCLSTCVVRFAPAMSRIGLSIARGIVDAHGGAVTLEPGAAGTTFLVRLPVEPPEGAGGAWEPVEVEIDD